MGGELPGVRGLFQAETSERNLERHTGPTVITWGKERGLHPPENSACEVTEATENLTDIPGMQDLSQKLVRR